MYLIEHLPGPSTQQGNTDGNIDHALTSHKSPSIQSEIYFTANYTRNIIREWPISNGQRKKSDYLFSLPVATIWRRNKGFKSSST